LTIDTGRVARARILRDPMLPGIGVEVRPL
jgi:hypothetical protein